MKLKKTLDLYDIIEYCNDMRDGGCVQMVVDALECVETVENIEDARANVEDALYEAKRIVEQLQELVEKLP